MTELKEFIEEVINQIKEAHRNTGAKIYDGEVTIDVAITTGNTTEQAGEGKLGVAVASVDATIKNKDEMQNVSRVKFQTHIDDSEISVSRTKVAMAGMFNKR